MHPHLTTAPLCACNCGLPVNPRSPTQTRLGHHWKLRTPEQFFWPHVQKTDTCWEWAASKTGSGYGALMRARKAISAHRFAFEMRYGPIPDDMDVLHTCDNPPCCRNDDEGTYEVNGILLLRFGHLFLGSSETNMHDKIRKGRQNIDAIRTNTPTRRGQDHPLAKLTWEQVRSIRAIEWTGKHGEKAIVARHYRISQTNLGDILSNRTWHDR